jgi:NTE family protein
VNARSSGTRRSRRAAAPPVVALALQGGGAHGAFTWGALDRLLDEVAADRLRVGAISGTSAGAINGALCARGLLDGPEAARALLRRFWQASAERAYWGGNPFVRLLQPAFGGTWNLDWTPLAVAVDMLTQVISPYDVPFYANPLRDLLKDLLPDLGRLNAPGERAPRLFIGATNVGTNARKVFEAPEITIEALLASTCIPTAFRAIEDGQAAYWDGGFTGNPPLEPLLDVAQDVILVQINPLERGDMPPRSARDILDRLNEIIFNASLVLELNGINVVNKLLAETGAAGTHYRAIRFHRIADDAFMQTLGVSSKSNPSLPFLEALHDKGRAAADAWLRDNPDCLGRRSSCDIERDFLKPVLKAPAHRRPAAAAATSSRSAADRRPASRRKGGRSGPT